MRTDVLGVGFDDLTLEEAAAAGAALVEAGGFHYAVTPNPEFLLAAKHNPAFRQALLGADLVLADGVGVVYSAKILGRPLKGKVPGIDFAQRLLAWMARHGKRLFLLGAKPGVAELAAANLKDAHPGLIVCGTHDGYFRTCSPAWWSGPRRAFRGWGWSGSTAWPRNRSASDAWPSCLWCWSRRRAPGCGGSEHAGKADCV